MENWTRYMQDYDGLQRLTVSPSAANSSNFYSELHHDMGSRLPGLTRQGGKHTLQRPKTKPSG